MISLICLASRRDPAKSFISFPFASFVYSLWCLHAIAVCALFRYSVPDLRRSASSQFFNALEIPPFCIGYFLPAASYSLFDNQTASLSFIFLLNYLHEHQVSSRSPILRAAKDTELCKHFLN